MTVPKKRAAKPHPETEQSAVQHSVTAAPEALAAHRASQGYTMPTASTSPTVPQGPSNTAQNPTGPASPMGTIQIATGPNVDGLRHQGLVAAQGAPGMDHLTDDAILASRAPAPKET